MAVTPINIRMPSVRSLLLRTLVGGQQLATATGFVTVHHGAHFLVTNWHVVSGRHPADGSLISKTGAVPHEVTVLHNLVGKLGYWTSKVEPLYDASGDPLWLEHPVHGRRVDVVALPITQDQGVDMHPYERFPQPTFSRDPRPGTPPKLRPRPDRRLNTHLHAPPTASAPTRRSALRRQTCPAS